MNRRRSELQHQVLESTFRKEFTVYEAWETMPFFLQLRVGVVAVFGTLFLLCCMFYERLGGKSPSTMRYRFLIASGLCWMVVALVFVWWSGVIAPQGDR